MRETSHPIDLLRLDHQHMIDLIDTFETATSTLERKQIAERVIRELQIHKRLAEEVFYPAARQSLLNSDLLDQAEAQHEGIDIAIDDVQKVHSREVSFTDTFFDLANTVRRHIQEEETVILPQIDETELDLEALGRMMRQRKEEIFVQIAPVPLQIAELSAARARRKKS